MIKKYVKFFLLIWLVAIVMLPQLVLAEGNPALGKLEAVGSSDKGPYTAVGWNSVSRIIGAGVGAALSLIGVIFLILMIYAGYNWMTAQGEEEKVEKAKNIIIAAVIGLVIVIAAYAVSWFVINSLSGAALKSGANKTLNGQEQEQSVPIKSDLPTFDPVPF